MKSLLVLLPFLLFCACVKDDEIGTKTDCDYFCPPYSPSLRDTSNGADEYDEYFKYQWHLSSAQYFSINVVPAWKITKGAGIKVAVLDDAIQASHEDFDNIAVYNILDKSDDCEPSVRNKFSHGTAASGVIAARQNGVGTMGVAPQCDFLFIGDSSSDIYSDAVAIRAFEYAKNWGARVISCSWGSYQVSSTLSSHLKNLYDFGVTIVFACGNGHINLDDRGYNDESELPWVIGVSSSDENGERASFSNYGRNIDIMAPGVSILAPDLMGAEGGNNLTDGLINDNYGHRDGTSFSAPIVAGVAALILSAAPWLTPDQVRTTIIKTAQKSGSAQYDAAGFSITHAYGLIDAAAAVEDVAPPCDDCYVTSISE